MFRAILLEGESIQPQSEVVRAIMLEDSPYSVGCPHPNSAAIATRIALAAATLAGQSAANLMHKEGCIRDMHKDT